MKGFMVVLGIIVGFGLSGCEKGSAQIETADIEINSVKCDMCVENVEKAIEGVDGVREVSVDLDARIASVEFESDKTDLEGLEQVIAAAGYSANDTERDPEGYDELPSCCQ